jgi:hypothetical protein
MPRTLANIHKKKKKPQPSAHVDVCFRMTATPALGRWMSQWSVKQISQWEKSTPPAPSTVPSPVGPPKRKCEGCVHCDLLDLKVLEPARIRHYLKKHEFLESATCTGACTNSIRAINVASPNANLHYCDVGKRGCDAPDDDPTKASMEYGLWPCARPVMKQGAKGMHWRTPRRVGHRAALGAVITKHTINREE